MPMAAGQKVRVTVRVNSPGPLTVNHRAKHICSDPLKAITQVRIVVGGKVTELPVDGVSWTGFCSSRSSSSFYDPADKMG